MACPLNTPVNQEKVHYGQFCLEKKRRIHQTTHYLKKIEESSGEPYGEIMHQPKNTLITILSILDLIDNKLL